MDVLIKAYRIHIFASDSSAFFSNVVSATSQLAGERAAKQALEKGTYTIMTFPRVSDYVWMHVMLVMTVPLLAAIHALAVP